MSRTIAAAIALPAAAALAIAASALTAPPAAGYPVTDITFVGHGYGHGEGMGQYGAYGYASGYGWSYQEILAHYYGGTYLSTTTTSTISVSIDELQGASDVTFYVPGATLSVDGVKANAIRVHDNGNGTYDVYGQANCSAASSSSAGPVSSVTVQPPAPDDTAATVIEVCQLGSRAYQGSFTVTGGVTTNVVPLEQYVAGVVPSESIASWGASGGEAALQAQAVAARSYALSYVASSGQICDTQSCQVYGGDPDLGPDAAYASYSDSAVTSTAGQVLRCSAGSACGAAGTYALAEYSSSTGGYTAGGAFPAVPDLGDATPSNPNHDWTTSVSVASIQSAYPQIGELTNIAVTQRNGLGDLGGRVLSMVLSGTAGTVTVSGQDFAWAVGLMSDWFAISQPLTGPLGGVDGYWVVGSDGSVLTFGAAPNYGSTAGDHLNAPIVGMAPTADQGGYWEVGSDGGIFTFGDAAYLGSTGNIRLNKPVVGMARTPDGHGYWLVAADGGVFTFGDARYVGSLPGEGVADTVVGLTPTADAGGYLLVGQSGAVYPFGDAPFLGDVPETYPSYSVPVAGIAAHDQ